MKFRTAHLPSPIARKVRAYHRRRRSKMLLRVILITLTVYLLAALAAMHVDRLLFLQTGQRVALFWIVHGLAALTALAGAVWWMIRRPSTAQTLYDMESRLGPSTLERYVTLENVLSHDQPLADPDARQMLRQLEDSAVDHSRHIRISRLSQDPALRRWLAAAALIVLIYVGLGLLKEYQLGLMIQRLVQPYRNLPKASFVKLAINPGNALMGQGDEMVLRVQVQGGIPIGLGWLYRWAGVSPERAMITLAPAGASPLVFDPQKQTAMTRVQRDLFLLTRSDLQESLDYVVRCGDAQTAAYRLNVANRPRVVEMSIHITPPEYTGLPPQTINQFGRPIFFLKNSKVVFTFKTDQPVSRRTLLAQHEDEPVSPQWDEASLTGRYEFILREKTAIRVQVANTVQGREFANTDQSAVVLGLRPDRTPEVTTDVPEGEVELSATDALPLRIWAEDDLGLTQVSLVYAVNPDWDKGQFDGQIKLPLPPDSKTKATLSTLFDLAQTKANPGDLVQLQAAARDGADNLGLSRPLRIRVVPTTRGENERRRLASLRFLGQAMEEINMSSIPAGGVPGQAMLIDASLHQNLVKRAKAIGASLPPAPSLESFLQWLEIEHHFTDLAAAKEDLRLFHGLLLSIADPLPQAEKVNPYDQRNERVNQWLGDLLPELTRYRQVKSLVIQMLGLRQEANLLAQTMGELAREAHPDASRVESVGRRAASVVQSITKDMKRELLRPRLLPANIDREALDELFSEMDATGRQALEGSLSERQTAVRQLAAHLVTLVNLMRQDLPELAQVETKARQRLRDEYEQVRRRIVAGAPEGVDGQRWRRVALDWLASDSRMMEMEPFQPIWPRLVNWALARSLGQPPAESKTPPPFTAETRQALESLWRSSDTPPLTQAATVEQRTMVGMEAAWQIDQIIQDKQLANPEKALLLALARLELAHRLGVPATEAIAQLKQINLLNPMPTLPPALIASVEPDSDYPAAFASLKQAGQPALEQANVLSELQRLKTLMDLSNRALSEVARSQAAYDYPAVAQKLALATAAVEQEEEFLRQLVETLWLRLALLHPQQPSAELEEYLMISLRDMYYLPPVQVGQLLTDNNVAGLVRVSREDLRAADADFQQLRNMHSALLGQVNALVPRVQQNKLPTAQEWNRLILGPGLTATRRDARTAWELLSPEAQPAQVARQYLNQSEEAGLIYLRRQLPLVQQIASRWQAALQAISTAGPQVSAYQAAVAQAGGMLRQFRSMLESAGSSALAGQLRQDARKLEERAAGLADLSATTNATRISRLHYDLGEMIQQIGQMESNLWGAMLALEQEQAPFQGGPGEIWIDALWLDARHSRQRILEQTRLARQTLTLGVLESLQDQPQNQRYRQAVAQSMFMYRLLRSELAESRRQLRSLPSRPATSRLAVLLAELEKALKNQDLTLYAAPTMTYLEFIQEQLRQ